MTIEELRERQHWTLTQKIDHSLGVIDQFSSHFGGMVFVSFSGGKDSCVMLDLVRVIIPDVKCMFIMTGCESPSVCRFVRQKKAEGIDIDIIRPEKTLRQVFADCGFPLVSKEVSHDVQACRRNPTCKSSLRKLDMNNPHGIPERWRYLLTEPYEVSDRCCFWLKKQPSHKYIKQTGRRPFLGLLADEGYTRQSAYVKRGGCNTFSETGKRYATSWPLAIWTNADVWQYINERHLPIPDIYDHGATRTGCLGCGFGAYKDKVPLDPLPRLWPKMYQAIMDYENNGIRYGDALAKSIERGHHRLQRKPKADQPPADPTPDSQPTPGASFYPDPP